ncbi:hypothetical protein GGR58DRAFT_501320 [Xylaria digitata]|nr:hypothetical protein GGR58DRAFT_501320 [Xylaria digitata]
MAAEEASILFLKWSPIYEKEKPFQIFADLLSDAQDRRKDKLAWDIKDVLVEDIRDRGEEFQLDTRGFTAVQIPGFTDLIDHETIEKEYIPVVKNMAEEELGGVGIVLLIDWRIRSSENKTENEEKINYSNLLSPLLPFNYAHTDMAPIAVIRRIQNDYPEQAERMLRQRIRAVNVWKPLGHPVSEWSLAMCDGVTLAPDDVVETDAVRRGFINTFYYSKYSENQKWYFLKNQTPDEALIFKHFDSDPDVPVPFTLHSSIKQNHVPENSVRRKSIEIRLLVFSDKFDDVDDIKQPGTSRAC